MAVADSWEGRTGATLSRDDEPVAPRAGLRSPPIERFVWGTSVAMRELRERIAAVAPTRSAVLLIGETGTGKGVIARALHARSNSRDDPFVHFDCAGVPPSLLESALFGHERGAFTGAHARRIGRVEAAGAGTLFLDEVAELELVAQARLLRLLQDHCFERVGGERTQRLEARVVAATNRDLVAAVAAGEFRADLFHRLAVVALRVPSVRERPADIPGLLACAAERARQRTGAPTVRIAPAALRLLIAHAWPGNVREIMNVMERAAACWPGRLIDVDLVSRLLEPTRTAGPAPAREDARQFERSASRPVEPDALQSVVAHCAGNVSRAARTLGMPRSTLRYRLGVAAGAAVPGRDFAQPCLPGFEAWPAPLLASDPPDPLVRSR